MYIVYILYSTRINRYYVGSTNNIIDRIRRHNTGQGNFTKLGIPWIPVLVKEMKSRSQAVRLEVRIKKRGARRFILDRYFGV